jgi:hypothetical protein
MKSHKHLLNNVLDSSILNLLQLALDDACKEVGGDLDTPAKNGVTPREFAARAIIALALEGARDRGRLQRYAAQALTKRLAA